MIYLPHTLKPPNKIRHSFVFYIHILIESLEILLLPNLKENLHGVSVIIKLGEPRQVLLNFIPLSREHFLVKVLRIEEEPRLFLQPTRLTTKNTYQIRKKPLSLPNIKKPDTSIVLSDSNPN